MQNNVLKVVLICLLFLLMKCSTQIICYEKGMIFSIDNNYPKRAKIEIPLSEFIAYHSKNTCFSCDTFWKLYRYNRKALHRWGMRSGDNVNICDFYFILIDSSIAKIDSTQFNDSCLNATVLFTIKKDGETIFRAISKNDTLDSRIKVKDNRIEEMKAIVKYE